MFAEIYSGLVGTAFILSVTRSAVFFYVCVNAARILHNRMFGAVLRAPIRFFDTNPIGKDNCQVAESIYLGADATTFHLPLYSVMCAGRVLNRFSKDLGFLDDIIPQPFSDYLAVSIALDAPDLCKSASYAVPPHLLLHPMQHHHTCCCILCSTTTPGAW